jgi:hypothetical protein
MFYSVPAAGQAFNMVASRSKFSVANPVNPNLASGLIGSYVLSDTVC